MPSDDAPSPSAAVPPAAPVQPRVTRTAPTPPPEPDWTDQVADMVVDLVDSVRQKTTGPILKVARGVVYGTVALIAAIVLLIVGLAFLGRVISIIPIAQWISYLVLGVAFTAIGVLLWGKRYAR